MLSDATCGTAVGSPNTWLTRVLNAVSGGNSPRTLALYVDLYRRYASAWLVVGLCWLLSIALQLPMPLLSRYIIDTVLPGHKYTALDAVGCTLVFLTALNLLAGFIVSYFSFRVQKAIALRMTVRLTEHFLLANLQCENRWSPGYVQQRLTSEPAQLTELAMQLLGVVGELATITVGVVCIFVLNVRLAVLSVLLLPLFALSLRLLQSTLKRLDYSVKEQQAVISGTLTEILQAREFAKVYGIVNSCCRRLRRAMIAEIRLSLAFLKRQSVCSSATSFLAAAGPLLVVWYGGHEIMRGRLTIGGLVAFSYLLAFLYAPTKNLLNARLSLIKSMVSMERIAELLALQQEDECSSGRDKSVIARPSTFRIRFSNVWFAYDRQQHVLRDLTFEVPDQESVALIGPVGAGKSTILKLLIRLYAPQSGTIAVGNTNISGMYTKTLRSQIAYVQQEPFLFNTTILENIRIGRPFASDSEVIAAARAINVYDCFESFPQGFETMVGVNGKNLSGGQRQLVCIARAMLRDSPILLLDEPLSAVDSVTEDAVHCAIRRLAQHRTTIVISHRLSIISLVHRCIVIEAGTVTGSGVHERLLQSNKFYQEIASSQYSGQGERPDHAAAERLSAISDALVWRRVPHVGQS